MRITTLAVALAAAFGASAALAQVTVYGIADAGYLYTKPANGASSSELVDGIQSPSRFGIRGNEALSHGLKASFVLEGGFSIDDGKSAQGGRLFGRQAWIGLGHKTGELRFGRQYGVGYEYFINDTSPFGVTFRDAGAGSVFSSASGRLILDNMVELRSGRFGGFSGALGYSFNANGTEVAGSSNNFKVVTGGVQYRRDNAYLAVSYEQFGCAAGNTLSFNSCNAKTRDDQSHLQVGGSIEFKPVRVYAMWALEKNQFSFFAITPAKKSQSYEAGVKLKLLGGEVLASYQARRDQDWGADLDTWGLGYTYPLSKRTNLYTFVADTQADAKLVAVAAGGAGYTKAQIDAYTARDRTQFGLGLRHLF